LKKQTIWIIVGVTVILYLGGRFLYFKHGLSPGEKVPQFNTSLADGSAFSLDQLQGNYVLLDFWGSWCGPCIGDRAILPDLYREYHTASFTKANGFDIVSIAIEKSEGHWREALRKFDPLWPYQILDESSNLRFFDGRIAKQFGVKRLPAKFLLDPEGRVIEVNPSWEKVRELLNARRI
jgi:thiol-disulfide isomerase/thioredoxin